MASDRASEVKAFLEEFNVKLTTFNIFFVNRKKNEEALLQLEITAAQRLEIIKSISVPDYSRGPDKDAYDPESPPNWVFGKMVKGKEVYIKINRGKPNKRVMCISFHIAEDKMIYPLR